MKRVVTAAILAPAAFLVIVSAPYWLFASLTIAVAVCCFQEYSRLAAGHSMRFSPLLGHAAGLVLLLTPHLDPAAVLLVCVLAALAVSLGGEPAAALPATAALAFGVLYCYATWRCGFALRNLSPYWLLFALSVNWVGDTFAYAGGRLLGRHKLAPRISPGKTWEGALASVAGALLFGKLFMGYFLPSYPWLAGLALTAVSNVAGQLGDLCESAMKRGAGVKDSGSILPGHGGWLDRLDSSLFTMPVVYVLLTR